MLDKAFINRSFWLILIILLFLNPGFAAKKSAGLAMALCVFPGGGQFYTARYVPGIVIASGEMALGYYAYKYHTQERYSERNSLLWWNLFLFGYSLADAYVGAKMYGFDIETDINKVGLKFTLKW
jgi:hypothetical protein